MYVSLPSFHAKSTNLLTSHDLSEVTQNVDILFSSSLWIFSPSLVHEVLSVKHFEDEKPTQTAEQHRFNSSALKLETFLKCRLEDENELEIAFFLSLSIKSFIISQQQTKLNIQRN